MLTINEIRIEDQRGGVAVVTDRIRPRFSFSMTSGGLVPSGRPALR